MTRLIDRDLRSPDEVALLEASGTRVLGRRHIESYLFDEEVISRLCQAKGQPEKAAAAIEIRRAAIEASVGRGNDRDDVKRAAGDIANGLRRLLALEGAGSTADAFGRDTLAEHVRPGMRVYAELSASVFPDA